MRAGTPNALGRGRDVGNDPRKEPEERAAVITGVRRTSVLKKLETLSPMPSRPPLDEPGGVIAHIEHLARMHREDAAYALARVEEAREEIREEVGFLKVELENFRSDVDTRLTRLEGNHKSLAEAVLEVAQKQNETFKRVEHLQTTWEDAYNNFDRRLINLEQGRVPRIEGRLDQWEERMQKFQAEILRHIDAVRDQINGGAPETPKVQPDDSGGPETLRPKK